MKLDVGARKRRRVRDANSENTFCAALITTNGLQYLSNDNKVRRKKHFEEHQYDITNNCYIWLTI